jgi:hypothetical protein
MSQTNKLLRLAGHLEALPKQSALKQSKFQLETIQEKATTHATSLACSFTQLQVLRSIVENPRRPSPELKAQRKSLRLVAQILAQQANTSQPEKPKITGALDTLAKQSAAVAEAVSNAWDEANKDVIDVTQALVDLTAKFDPTTQIRLQTALNAFKSVGRPSNPEEIARYQAARSHLQELRQQVAIPGSVGEFLSEALAGRGSIGSLLSTEVQAFLDNHTVLKSRLTVKLS